MKLLNTQSADFQSALQALLAFETAQDPKIDQIVADICADVQKRGDAAVIEYSNRFDSTSAQSMADLTLTQADLQAAFERLPANVQTALQQSAARVESYHQRQKMQSWHYTDEDGTLLGQQISALHAFRTWASTNQDGNLCIFKGNFWVVSCNHACQQRECTVLQFHHHAFNGILCLWQIQ